MARKNLCLPRLLAVFLGINICLLWVCLIAISFSYIDFIPIIFQNLVFPCPSISLFSSLCIAPISRIGDGFKQIKARARALVNSQVLKHDGHKIYKLTRNILVYFTLIIGNTWVYGSPTSDISFDVPVYVNGRFQCETTFKLEEGEEKVDIRPIFDILSSLVNKRWKQLVKMKLGGLTFEVTPIQVDQKIEIQFVQSSQSVEIKVEPDIFIVQEVDLLPQRPQLSHPNLIYPEKFSSYMNLNVSEEFRHYYFSPSSSQSSFFGSTNFCFNFDRVVLEGFLYFLTYTKGPQKGLSNRFNRGNIFLTKDSIGGDKRFIFGDVSPERVSFQNSAPLLGMQVTRNPAIFGKTDPNIGPVGQYEFFLNAPSKVDVYINDIFIRTIDLPAGPQLLRNFPYADGLNQVDLVISDRMGNVTNLNLNQFFSSKLLRPGQYIYSASFGFPRFQEISQRYKYLFSNPACSAYIRRGFNESLTGSCYLQATTDSFFSGLALLHANRLIYMESEFGLSYSPSNLWGTRKKLSFQNMPNTTPFSWRFSFDYFSKYFSNFLAKERVNNQKCSFYGSISKPVGKVFNTYLNASYGISRKNASDNWSIGWNLTGIPKKGISLSVLTSYRKLSNGPKFFESVFSLNIKPYRNTNVSANYNSRTKISNVYGSYSKSLSRNRSVSTSVGYTQAKSKKQITGFLNYLGDRGSIQLDHYLYENALLPVSSDSNVSSVTRINGRTALVYADRTFAISRPVSNNFAIIQPRAFLKPYPIDVYSNISSTSLSRSSKFMPAVITQIPSYQDTVVHIDSESLPLGYDLGKTTYTLHANYKCGFKIHVGGKGKLQYAEGFLKDANGQPVAYKNIKVINESGLEEESRVFTNSQGKFCLFHIYPGVYQLKIQGLDHEDIEVSIPKDSTQEIICLGMLVVEECQKDSGFYIKNQ